MKKVFSVMLLFVLCFCVYAGQLNSKIIPLSSKVYEYTDIMYALSDCGVASNTRPWSSAEARLILSRIDKSKLPPSAAKLYDYVYRKIEEKPRWSLGDNAAFGASLQLNPEIYTHTNTEDFISESQWVYKFPDRKHILTANVEMSMHDYFYSYCDLMYGQGRFDSIDSDREYIKKATDEYIASYKVEKNRTKIGTVSHTFKDKFLFNMPSASKDFDFVWPKRADFSVGGQTWNLFVGRDRIDWGNSHIGNFLIDDHADYNEFASVRFFSDKFKYDFATVFIEADVTPREDIPKAIKMLLAHRLEFRFSPKFTVAVSENVMFESDKLVLQYFNPANIFHNYNNRGMFNAIATLELDYSIANRTNIYTQFVLDQARAPNERDEQSSAFGILAGLEFTKAFDSFIYSGSLECSFATPMLYRRDEVDFVTLRKYFVMNESYVCYFDYLGSPYGGNALVADFRNKIIVPEKAELCIDLRMVKHGPMNVFESHNVGGNNDGLPDRYKKVLTLESPVTTTEYLSINLQIPVKLISEMKYIQNCEAFIQTDFVKTGNNIDKQLSAGLSVEI